MNYRHIYHAGNFADVMKHWALILCLEHLTKKDTPFCVIDAHGGCGNYDLSSDQAQKTGEWIEGIGKFQDINTTPTAFQLYQLIIQHALGNKTYAGSPLIIANNIRAQDRLIANELHPEDVRVLRKNLQTYKNTRIQNLDAYECIRANIPPLEKRGLILIDPPFEKRDEFETLCDQMFEWKKRFPTGIYIIWYPIKAHLDVMNLKDAAIKTGFHRTWIFETLKYPREQAETFNGSGLMIFNAPFGIPEIIEQNFDFLKETMNLHACHCAWLTSQ